MNRAAHRLAGPSAKAAFLTGWLICWLAVAGFVKPAAAQSDVEELSRIARPAIVFLKYFKIEKTGEKDWTFGSGFIVNKSGLVVTAYHVVAPWLTQAAAKQNPQQEKERNPLLGYVSSINNPHPIQLEYLDGNEVSDVALLRLRYPGEYAYNKVCFLDAISSGARIVAFGFPFGREFTPFEGFLSNDDAPEGRWSANVNFESGASGGPVFDTKRARVIGLVKGGLSLVTTNSTVPVGSVRYVTPVVRLRTILTNHGIDPDCGETALPARLPGQIPIDDKSVAQLEMLRQQDELFARMSLLVNNAERPGKPFAIDTLARRYEGQDPDHVGIDATGGAYYGAYRIQAGPNMDGFFAYLRRNNPKLAERLAAAGGSKAAKERTSAFVSEWRSIAESPEFAALQLQFILATDFAKLTARMKRPVVAEEGTEKGLGLDVMKRSLALQAVIFSIANQHGPATTLPFDALAPLGNLAAKSDADLINALFAARSRVSFYFPKLNSEKFAILLKQRNELEKRDALFMLQN